jgi:hypothetical protein
MAVHGALHGDAGLNAGHAMWADEVFVVCTTMDETLAAVRVAGTLGRALDVPLTLLDFRPRSTGPLPDRDDTTPERVRELLAVLGAAEVTVRARVYVSDHVRAAVATAFRPHSLVVIGGRPSWWPTRLERFRRMLEAQGHFVVCAHAEAHEETSHA